MKKEQKTKKKLKTKNINRKKHTVVVVELGMNYLLFPNFLPLL